MTPAQRIQNKTARPWLPPGAFDAGLAERALAPAVARWSAKWFASVELALSGAFARWAGEAGEWQTLENSLALSANEEAQVELAALMLGAAPDAKAIKPADRALLLSSVQPCLRDLESELAGVFELPRNLPWEKRASPAEFEDARIVSLGVRGRPALLRLAVDAVLLVPLIRSAAPPDGPKPRLASLDRSLEKQEIYVSALIGRSTIALADLATVGPGDVLRLDRAAEDPVALAIDHKVTPTLCRIEQDGGTLRLRLVEQE